METKLYKWFLKQRERHVTVTSHMLKEKALQLYAKHYGDNKFSASRGWINKFKKRHGVRHLKVSEEQLPSTPNVIKPFLQKLAEKMKEMNLKPNQIYNADESALFWNLLPDVNEKVASECTLSKKRIHFLACANGDGTHKLKMMVFGKLKNPKAFKNCAIPLEYYSTKNACMTSALFVKWFHKSFVNQVRRIQKKHNINGKALLLIDNVPSRATETLLTSEDGNIVTMFLPPNCTQPIDQNAIQLTKMYYRKSLLVHVLFFEENNISNNLKNMNLKDAIFLLASAWEKVTPDAIQKCWHKLLLYLDDNDFDWDSEDLVPLSLLRSDSFSEQRREITNMLERIGTEKNQVTEPEICEWIVGDEDYLLLQ